MISVSHDPFARESLVRRIVHGGTCDNCGGNRVKHGEITSALFQYGTERDDRPGEKNVNWHKGKFCSKSCHDSYHG